MVYRRLCMAALSPLPHVGLFRRIQPTCITAAKHNRAAMYGASPADNQTRRLVQKLFPVFTHRAEIGSRAGARAYLALGVLTPVGAMHSYSGDNNDSELPDFFFCYPSELDAFFDCSP